jgi:predicted phosphodiesterase
MSKILVYADPHICENSSVIRGKGNKYSHRLETLKETFNWINKLAVEKECKHIVCLGDLFDSSSLTADEITVAAQCNISHHIFIVGNHDANVKSLETNAVNMFEKSLIISKRCALGEEDGIPFFALPYETEEDREPLPVGELDTIIFSHNDIKGIQMGPHLSTVGFDKQEIMDSCGLFINGHLHNGGWVETGKILNLGAVTGLNFSSDASKWTPRVAIIDTMGSSIEFVENPYAYLFYSVKLNKIEELYPFLDTIPRYGYPILSIIAAA